MTDLARLDGQPTWLLSRANARAQLIVQVAFKQFGLRGYHFRLLAALDEFGPASQADLGRRSGIDRSDVVAALNDLVRDCLAVRNPDPSDRRRNVVSITRQGAEMLQRLDAALAEAQEVVLEPLSARDQATLLRLLARIGQESSGTPLRE